MNEFKLNLIIGGVQKGGTTSLFEYLRAHPSLFPPQRKETHFFDDETIDWSRPNYELLKRYYPNWTVDRTAFDVTPIYLFWPCSLERIKRYNPAIKLIFIFRDPIERAWSQWRMEHARQAERLPFSLAIRQGRWRLRGIPPLDPAWRVYSYVERGFYARQVAQLLELFPRENVLFLRSQDLQRDHSEVLASIADFLTLPPFPKVAARLDHQGVAAPPPLAAQDIEYLRGIFRDDTVEFSRLTGLTVSDWPTMAAPNPADAQ